jgi:hypothetical protein
MAASRLLAYGLRKVQEEGFELAIATDGNPSGCPSFHDDHHMLDAVTSLAASAFSYCTNVHLQNSSSVSHERPPRSANSQGDWSTGSRFSCEVAGRELLYCCSLTTSPELSDTLALHMPIFLLCSVSIRHRFRPSRRSLTRSLKSQTLCCP